MGVLAVPARGVGGAVAGNVQAKIMWPLTFTENIFLLVLSFFNFF